VRRLTSSTEKQCDGVREAMGGTGLGTTPVDYQMPGRPLIGRSLAELMTAQRAAADAVRRAIAARTRPSGPRNPVVLESRRRRPGKYLIAILVTFVVVAALILVFII
jgi:hypothetical protein